MKKFSLLVFFICITFSVYSETTNEYIDSLLIDLKKLSQTELKQRYIKIAQIKETIGELSEAAKFYKKASLVVNGKKDFNSLYKSSVLNTEMAFYEQAKTDLKAILMFSDDKDLRMSASILESKIKFLEQNYTESLNILKSILDSGENITNEGLLWVNDFLQKTKDIDIDTEEISRRYKILNIKDKISKIFKLKPFNTPETVFTKNNSNTEDSEKKLNTKDLTETATEEFKENDIATGIQVGSFSVKENAEELKNVLLKESLIIQIKEKNINGEKYYSVIVEVEDGEDLQRKMIGLKEKGYEGYPVY